MSAIEIDGRKYVPEGPLRRGFRSLRRKLGDLSATAMAAGVGVAMARSAPAAQHVSEHAYTIAGLGLIDGAMFVHSVFTGLLVTGLSFFVFEFKTSKEG